jgi:hypothetical protein
MKQVLQLDSDGYFIGVTFADESPLEPGVYLIPAGCVEMDEPAVPTGKKARWMGEWIFEDILQDEPQSESQSDAELSYEDLRYREYPPMADYLDALVKNDEEKIQDYINKCLAVKLKYPKPQ